MRPWQKLLARAGHLRPLLLAHQSLPAPFPDAGLTTPEPNKSHLSNRQIAGELGLDASDVQIMTEQLRRGLVAKAPAVELKGEVEVDEVHVVAGHKGQPAAVAKGGGLDGAASCQVRQVAARWKRTSRLSSV